MKHEHSELGTINALDDSAVHNRTKQWCQLCGDKASLSHGFFAPKLCFFKPQVAQLRTISLLSERAVEEQILD